MIDAPIGLAFTAGLVATVNPCGFAMLPAYLGYFLGIEGTERAEERTTTQALLRALVVGAVVSAGFLVLFAAAGMLVKWTSIQIGDYSPWLTVIIGVVLTVAGVAFIAGWEPTVLLPKLNKGGRDRGLWSMFLFGLSYAIASLSCTIGPFSSVVISAFTRGSAFSGLATFAAYALGMSLLLMALTVTLALAERGLVTALRRFLPYVSRVSGGIMVLMGAYLAWYGVYEIQLSRKGEATGQGPVDLVTGWSSDVSEWFVQRDALQVALVLGLVLAVVVLAVLLRSGHDHPSDPGPSAGDDAPAAPSSGEATT